MSEKAPPRVLIIEDDPDIRVSFQLLLEHQGYVALTASNGKEGLRRFLAEPFDIVITDIIMPEQEGLETIRLMIKEKPGARIIAISGGGRNSPEGYLMMAEQLGAVKVFEKPVDMSRLYEVMNEFTN